MPNLSSKNKEHIFELTSFEKKVLDVCAEVPKGHVATYGDVARKIGASNASRAVGNVLNKNPFAPKIPCHRVVRSDGKIGGFATGAKRKIELLRGEGIGIDKEGKIKYFSKIRHIFQ